VLRYSRSWKDDPHVEELSTRFQGDSSIGIEYMYCNFKRQSQQTLQDLLMSILKQLAQRESSLPESVLSLYTQCNSSNARPYLGDISTSIQSVTTEF
jgi:hypothetical protein